MRSMILPRAKGTVMDTALDTASRPTAAASRRRSGRQRARRRRNSPLLARELELAGLRGVRRFRYTWDGLPLVRRTSELRYLGAEEEEEEQEHLQRCSATSRISASTHGLAKDSLTWPHSGGRTHQAKDLPETWANLQEASQTCRRHPGLWPGPYCNTGGFVAASICPKDLFH